MKRRQLSRLLLVLVSLVAMTITISNCGDDSTNESTGTGSGDWIPFNVGCSWTFKGKYTDTFNNVTTITANVTDNQNVITPLFFFICIRF